MRQHKLRSSLYRKMFSLKPSTFRHASMSQIHTSPVANKVQRFPSEVISVRLWPGFHGPLIQA